MKADGEAVEVKVEGVSGDLLRNIQGHLSLYQARKNRRLTPRRLRRLAARAKEEIRKALEPFGYYHARVDGGLEKESDGRWLARYLVQPGPRVKVVEAKIALTGAGKKEPELRALVQGFPLKPGTFFDHRLYEQAKLTLLERAGELGYLETRADIARVVVDPKRNEARIHLRIDTGHRFRFGELKVEQHWLDPDFLAAYLVDVRSGAPYSQALLARLQAGLVESGYFSLVEVRPLTRESVDNQVPVVVKLQAAPRHRIALGAGYDTDIGFNLNGRWLYRRVNSRGHKADARFRFSRKDVYLQGNYWIPLQDPRTTKLGFSLELEREYNPASERRTLDLGMGYHFRYRDWIGRYYAQFKAEHFLSGSTGELRTTLFSLGVRLDRNTVAEGVFPQSGWSLSADLRLSPGLVSRIAYLRGWLLGHRFFPVGEKGRFDLRGELGMAVVDDYRHYPNSLRFFAGGDTSVRGHAWKSLGPRDAGGKVVGGKDLLVVSAEYDHHLLEKWAVAAFVDAGNAFNNHFNKLYYGAGVGLRWFSPVGAVRLDAAWPFNQDQTATRFGDVRFHFGFSVSL